MESFQNHRRVRRTRQEHRRKIGPHRRRERGKRRCRFCRAGREGG
jgi:hypothetical protein